MAAPKWLFDFLVRLSGSDRAQRTLRDVMNLASDLQGMGPGGFQLSSGEASLVGRLEAQHAQSALPLCIFDVGAHHGEFFDAVAMPLTARQIPFELHAFEPGHESFQQLQSRHGNRANARLNNFGLGREHGTFELHADRPGSPLASFSNRRLYHLGLDFAHTEKVEMNTLDEYCLEHSVRNIDLLKLDVEGHELDVLQGGLGQLREHRVRLLTFEFGGCNIDSRTFFQDYWYFITENRIGDLFRFTPSGYLAPITEYSELYEQFRPTNYLVVCFDA